MCIRDSHHHIEAQQRLAVAAQARVTQRIRPLHVVHGDIDVCLLYTSDAADERSSVDLGGRRIIKKQKRRHISARRL